MSRSDSLQDEANAPSTSIPASTSNDGVQLKRQFGFFHGTAVICGLMIGSGIYIAPTAVVRNVGSPGLALVLWALTGVTGILGGLTYAELGATFPGFGEKYLYLEKFFSPLISYLYLVYYLVLARPGANAIKCMTFAKYLLNIIFVDCEPPEAAESLVAITLAVALTALNCVSVRGAAHSQALFTGLSTLALAAIAVTGFVHLAQGNTQHMELPFEGTSSDPVNIIMAVYMCTFASHGWTALNFILEETTDPNRTLPRAIVTSISLVTVLYVGANAAYLSVLGPLGVAQSDTVALTFARRAWGVAGTVVICLVIALSTAGSFNSGIMVGSRLGYAGARRGQIPTLMSYIQLSYLSPITALIFQCALAIVYILMSELYTLLYNMAFAMAVFDLLCLIGLIRFRVKYPDIPRPFKVPLAVPVCYALFIAPLVVLPALMDPGRCAVGLGVLLLLSLPYYLIMAVWRRHPSVGRHTITTINSTVQKLLKCVPQGEVDKTT